MTNDLPNIGAKGITVIYEEMPSRIKAFKFENEDSTFTIVINMKLRSNDFEKEIINKIFQS